MCKRRVDDTPLNHTYYLEQAVFVTAGFVFLGIFTALYIKSRSPQYCDRVSQLHKVLHPLGIILALVLLTWSIDPRALHGIYCVEMLVAIRDLFNFLLFYAGAEWFVFIVQLLYSAVSLNSDKKLNWIKWLFLVSYGSFALIVTIISFIEDKKKYRGLNMSVGAFVAALVAVICLLYYTAIRKSFYNPAKRASPESTSKFKAAERKILITALGYFVAAALLAYFASRTLRKKLERLEDLIPNPKKYDPYGLGAAHLVLVCLIIWMSWLPLCTCAPGSWYNRDIVSTNSGPKRLSTNPDLNQSV